MKCADGIWFPDSETHLVEMVARGPKVDGRGTYQYHKLDAALRRVKKRRCALDVGMHIGLWAMHLARQFDKVIGFEPVTEHIECLRLNMSGLKNYEVHHCAVGHQHAEVGLKFMHGSTGSTQVIEGGTGVSMVKLDDFDFVNVDFIKIDVENYEYFVVEGGENIIKRHRPIIILEQKGDKTRKHKSVYGKERHDAKLLLESWGARELFEMNGDHCMGWS